MLDNGRLFLKISKRRVPCVRGSTFSNGVCQLTARGGEIALAAYVQHAVVLLL